ncbi:glycosyltransferase involved in cell wall biosynthesis [Mumia flava]|uniref:Glycosyltransferase involved in cell wall biosynthesis n=1 Tax=Mumia flava TaxID=1348852 RepID=A0A2M9BK72_9ACTN|nr:glycosyltransferase family 2 protein [Mumia flava]PJJ58322.1 glycosyltransferase involved in cell wall biosynthesis [Mumia flava]
MTSRPSAPTVTVVVPAYNEARNLEVVLPQLPPVDEVVVVDGHSTDDTAAVVARVMPKAVLVQQSRRGKGNALACGFATATSDIVVMFDADGSADPAEIAPMVDALVSGADVAKGSRALPGGGSVDLTTIRALGNRTLTGLVNRLFRTGYTDLCYGYNAFWRDLVPTFDLPDPAPRDDVMLWGDGFEIETVLNCRAAAARMRVVEVPSHELARIHGTSNLHAVRDGMRVLRTIMAERRRMRGADLAAAAAVVASAPAVVEPTAAHVDRGGDVPVDRAA